MYGYGNWKDIAKHVESKTEAQVHIYYLRWEADVPLFETKSETCMISARKRVTALKFGTAVAVLENNMELRKNGGGTAAPAENRKILQFFIYIDMFGILQVSRRI